MPAPALAVPIAMGVLGGLGGKSSAKRANQPRTTRFSQTSRLQPYGGGTLLNDYLNNIMPGAYSSALGALPSGSNPFSIGAAGQLAGLLGGGGFDLPGIHTPQLGAAPIAGIPDEVWARLRSSGPGSSIKSLGIPVSKMTPEEIASWIDPNMPGELTDISKGAFIGGSPEMQAVIDASTRDATEAYSQTQVPALDSSFSLGGRTGSFSHAAGQALMNEEFQEDLQGMIAQMRLGDLQAERQRQMQALGLEADINTASRGFLSGMRNQDMSTAGSMRNAAIASAAQRALGEASIRSALAQANAAMKGQYDIANANFGLEGQAMGLQSAIAAAQLQQSGLNSLFGMGQGLFDTQRQAALDPFNLALGYGGSILPALAQFGTQTSSGYNTQPGANISPLGAFLTNGLGAGLSTYGMGQLGGKGGGAGSLFGSTGSPSGWGSSWL